MSATRYAKDLPDNDTVLDDRLRFYWIGLREHVNAASLQDAIHRHFQKNRFMPQVSEILDEIAAAKKAARSARPADVLTLTSGERFDLPRHPHLNPTLSDEERLIHVDEHLAKTDLELEAIGLNRIGLLFVRAMLTAVDSAEAARRRLRDRMAATSETYEMRPASEGLMSFAQAAAMNEQYAREAPKEKARAKPQRKAPAAAKV